MASLLKPMQNLSINPELKALIPPLTSEEFAQLEANVCQEGIREPIITWQGTIVDGHNRYELAQMYDLPFKVKELQFSTMEDCKEWMIRNQFGRRNLSNYQRSVLALELESVFREKAKENYMQNVGRPSKSEQISAPIKSIETRQELAKVANVSHDTIAKVKVIEAKAPEEVKAKLSTGEVSINQAYQDIKKEEKKAERDKKIEEVKQKIESENLVQPNKKYHVIAIDPPWAYSEKGGFSSDDYDATSNRGAVDYPTMTVEQISKIELPTADDCVIFLWTTHAFLRDSFELLDNWGFNYKATLVWDKVKMGLGRTIRMQVEFCLIGVKGNPIINGSSERDIITEPRREHSRKPEAFYQMAERMCIGNRLDFFSRQNRENWDHYGAESGQF
jgi:N6-adenosine-specific RNA methylase IME4